MVTNAEDIYLRKEIYDLDKFCDTIIIKNSKNKE